MEEINKKVTKFYDEFSSQQEKTGLNIRHLTIFNNLKKSGLKENSKVLEIGCGIGTVTNLIARFVLEGKIVAVDISPQSIEVAKRAHKNFSNVQFLVSDMSDFKSNIIFDFVVLPDVLEHIPLEQHPLIFKIINQYTHSESVVLINIPNPSYLRWLHKNKPQLLQIIDQPLSTDILLNICYQNDFHLHSLQVYSIDIEEGDYQSIVLKRGRDFEFSKVTNTSRFIRLIQKVKAKMKK